MTFVLDASLTLAWCFKDEATPFTNAVLELTEERRGVVPELWAYEVANGLVVGKRRSRISDVEIATFVRELLAPQIEVHHTDLADVLEEVRDAALLYRLSAYDAAYLEVARRLGLPIATLDGSGRRQGLKQAAEAAGVALLTL